MPKAVAGQTIGEFDASAAGRASAVKRLAEDPSLQGGKFARSAGSGRSSREDPLQPPPKKQVHSQSWTPTQLMRDIALLCIMAQKQNKGDIVNFSYNLARGKTLYGSSSYLFAISMRGIKKLADNFEDMEAAMKGRLQPNDGLYRERTPIW